MFPKRRMIMAERSVGPRTEAQRDSAGHPGFQGDLGLDSDTGGFGNAAEALFPGTEFQRSIFHCGVVGIV